MQGKQVDAYRFTDKVTKSLVEAWIRREKVREIPWTPLEKPMSEARVALVTSAAVVRKADRSFDLQGERDNPWWGDPSFRVIKADDSTQDVNVEHLHINTSYAAKDINCLLPLDRLRELVTDGVVGDMAPSHYSFMGYQLRTEALLQEATPEIVDGLQNDQVDVVLLVPV